jgi:hypothetical protein
LHFCSVQCRDGFLSRPPQNHSGDG